MQGGLTVNGAARRPSQPADSLDNFITSGKVASRGPSIFGGGGGALAPRVPSQRFQKLALADVWPDDVPGSGSQFEMGEMDGALPSQPFSAQHASRGQLHGAGAAGVSSAGSRACFRHNIENTELTCPARTASVGSKKAANFRHASHPFSAEVTRR